MFFPASSGPRLLLERLPTPWRASRQRARFQRGLIGAIIGVPIAAGIQIVVDEVTAERRARIAAADAAEQRQPA